jgi:hypothetical protein
MLVTLSQRPNETVEKPFICKFRSKNSHFGLKSRPNVASDAKMVAYFVVFVPLCKDESLQRDFFDSFQWFALPAILPLNGLWAVK